MARGAAGKKFESNLTQAYERGGWMTIRIPDAQHRGGGAKTPADFIAISRERPSRMVECKATKNESIGFSRLAEHQQEALTRWEESGGEALVAVCFYNGKLGRQRRYEVYEIPIYLWNHEQETIGRKSIPLSRLRESYGSFRVPWVSGLGLTL